MSYKVYIPQDIADEGKEVLQQQGYEVVVGEDLSVEAIKKDIENADAVLLRTVAFGKEILASGKKLKIVARHGAGYDNVDYKAAEEMGIWVTNSPYTTGLSVAENTLGAILMLAKRYEECEKELRKDNFKYKLTHKGMDLEGKTLGIIGFGEIGKRVAEKAALGFGMKICTPKRNGKKYPEYVTVVESVDDLLKKSDFVTLHVPGGAGTKNMISNNEFLLMKPTAYLINLSRGGVVDEDALSNAVRNKTIAGAFVDVYAEEPPKMDNPLFGVDNVILTPHMGSNTEECMIRIAVDAAEEIVRVLSGEKPLYPVNTPSTK